jgi:hypothetical protein
MSNVMTKSLLGYVFKTVQTRAIIMNYSENLPSLSQMSSLSKHNPSQEEINNDYSKLSKHFKHPIYNNFIPMYDESSRCIKTAWLKRYLDTTISYNNIKN